MIGVVIVTGKGFVTPPFHLEQRGSVGFLNDAQVMNFDDLIQ
jgi:hypothetical protein